MKRSRFTEEQIIAILKEQEAGDDLARACGAYIQVCFSTRLTGAP
jgi:hypothetical protein